MPARSLKEEKSTTAFLFPEQLLHAKPPALIQSYIRETNDLWAPLTDRETEAPRGTWTPQASQLVTQDTTPFQEGPALQGRRASPAQPAKPGLCLRLQEARGQLCGGPWLFPQTTCSGGVSWLVPTSGPHLISEMLFS